MKAKIFIYVLVITGILFSQMQLMQANEVFYYYGDEKIFLEERADKIFLKLDLTVATEEKVRDLKNDIESFELLTDINMDEKVINPFVLIETKNGDDMPLAFYEKCKANEMVLSATNVLEYENALQGLTGEFAVKLKSSSSYGQMENLALQNNCVILKDQWVGVDQYMISVSKVSGLNSLQTANLFYETGLFEFSEPDGVVINAFHSNDPYFSDQWGLKNTGQYSGTAGIQTINGQTNNELIYKNPAYPACYYDKGEDINNKNTIVNNNSVWNILSIRVEDETGIVNIPRYTAKIYFEGDSVVNNKAYKKVFYCTNDEFCEYPLFAGLIREENLKTHYIFAGQAQEYLLYDFSVEVNDIIEMYCPQIASTLIYQVHSIDFMNMNGISKKRIELTYPDSETITDIWVEDLGSLFDFITINPMVGYVKRLLCFYRDGVCLYHDPDYEACYYTTSISGTQQSGFQFFIRSETLNIEFDIPFNGDINLYETGGKLVYRDHLSNRFHHKINVSGFASGVYLLTLTADNGKKRFVKINHIK